MGFKRIGGVVVILLLLRRTPEARIIMNNVPWCFALAILATQLLTGAMERTSILDTIFLRYYGKTLEEYIDEPLNKASLLLSKMENNKPTMLHIHGFTEDVETESVTTVVRAYLQRGDHNVLAADYRNISAMRYPKAVKSASDVGMVLGIALNEMVEAGLDPKKLHVVGHSLGAQIAAHLRKKLKFEIPRIVGLDPAGPFFHVMEPHLSSKDARFVDIIHTDYGVYGIARTTGSVDFFPNGGHRLQPGCSEGSAFFSKDDYCSHRRSWKFYAESVTDEGAFLAVKCPSQRQFLAGECKNNEKVPMGFATPSTAKGTFYLITGADSPFGLKEDGVTP